MKFFASARKILFKTRNRKIISTIALLLIAILTTFFIYNNHKQSPHYLFKNFEQVVDLGPNQPRTYGLGGIAVSNRGYVAITDAGNLEFYNQSGEKQWTVSPPENSSFKHVDADKDGIVVVQNDFSSSPAANPTSGILGDLSFPVITPSIVKYGFNGKAIWRFQLPKAMTVENLAYDGSGSDDSVWLNGEFSGEVNLGKYNLISVGQKDVFLLNIADSRGTQTISWVKQIGSTGDDSVGGFSIDEPDLVEVTTGAPNSVIFDPTLARQQTTPTSGPFTGISIGPQAKFDFAAHQGSYLCGCDTSTNADGSVSPYNFIQTLSNNLLSFADNCGVIHDSGGCEVSIFNLTATPKSTVLKQSDSSNSNSYINFMISSTDGEGNPDMSQADSFLDSNPPRTDSAYLSAATGNRLYIITETYQGTHIQEYYPNLKIERSFDINYLLPASVYRYNNHIYLSGSQNASISSTTPDMKIFKLN